MPPTSTGIGAVWRIQTVWRIAQQFFSAAPNLLANELCRLALGKQIRSHFEKSIINIGFCPSNIVGAKLANYIFHLLIIPGIVGVLLIIVLGRVLQARIGVRATWSGGVNLWEFYVLGSFGVFGAIIGLAASLYFSSSEAVVFTYMPPGHCPRQPEELFVSYSNRQNIFGIVQQWSFRCEPSRGVAPKKIATLKTLRPADWLMIYPHPLKWTSVSSTLG